MIKSWLTAGLHSCPPTSTSIDIYFPQLGKLLKMVEISTESNYRRSELNKTLGFTEPEWYVTVHPISTSAANKTRATGIIHAALLGAGIFNLVDAAKNGAFDIGAKHRVVQKTLGMRGWQFVAAGSLRELSLHSDTKDH
jgi:hypothetical protein